ncbi:P-type DNA transfer ATPase VirB11 [Pseudomonas sp. LPH60]|uniref:P-type DNA transfer ATPase VirB11 n=1 Tax=Pseudomonas sp. LPH60 TaxID=3065906 RepID=UPI00273AAD01|nr:P-type DNA transfer ATPase VirB11 [Pseudomonas sp. LPH60]MDP4573443.1 P-type DNA transfer ATPase VirB11 [Pseudomonas sp. LPH60]
MSHLSKIPNGREAVDYLDSGIQRSASVDYLMEPIKRFMDEPEITEVCINRPGEVWCERQSVWEYHKVEELTFDHCNGFATAVAKFAKREISDSKPIMSAVLPGKERIQFVMPPAVEHGTISTTIRKPDFGRRTLEDYEKQGFFKHIRPIGKGLSPNDQLLLELKNSGKIMEFLRLAVEMEKVIVVAGETGSGKTSLMKAMLDAINPQQRIITIEDVPELFLPNHPNHVHLFYPSEASEEGGSIVTAASLLKSCLRMKPTRILLAELRGAETYDFVNVCASGHGGSITSLHAGSCEMALERMALMILQNRQGRSLPYDVIRRLLLQVVDVVVHVHNDVTHPDIGRHITEVWYEPEQKRAA